MDDIPKITLKPTQTVQSVAPLAEKPVEPEPLEVIQEPEETSMARKKKFPVGLVATLLFLLLLGGGAYAVFTQYVVWDDGTETQSSSSSEAYIPSKLPPPVESGDVASASDDEISSAGVKGKITATITREGGKVLEGGIVRILNSSGKIVKEVDTGKGGVAVFDGLVAGTYKVEGGKKGEARVVSQSVSIGDGELKDVSLSIFLDTPVSITVTVKKADGTPASDKTFTMRKIRSSESPLDYTVTTNNFGLFTKSDVSPDDKWLLIQNDQEVGSFTVAPTGKSQTINVQTTSN
jgi:hypothetical protein